MAAKVFYLKDALASGSNHLSLQDGGSPPSQVRISTGWVVGTLAATRYARMDSQTERASSAHLTTPIQPDGAPDNTLGDCFRSENTINGTFANANWSLSFQVEGETRSTSTHDGILRIRIWKSANADGSSPTELTGATITTTQYVNLANSAFQTITATWSPGAVITLTNEYLFIQIAHQLDGAGSNANSDTHLVVGSSNTVTTSNFVGINVLTATGIDTGASTVGTPVIGQIHDLIATGVTTGNPTLGTPELQEAANEDNLTANGIDAGSPTMEIPAIGQIHILTGAGISAGTLTIENPAIGQVHILAGEGIIAGTPTVENPAIGQIHNLTGTGITTGTPTLGSPAIEQIHILTGTGVTVGTPNIDEPDLNQIHTLIGSGFVTGVPIFGEPTISQIHDLSANGITTSAASIGAPVITQTHMLIAEAIITGAPTLGMPVLAEIEEGVNHLSANGITTGAFMMDVPTFSQIIILSAVGIIVAAPGIDKPFLRQVHALNTTGLVSGIPVLSRPEIKMISHTIAPPDYQISIDLENHHTFIDPERRVIRIIPNHKVSDA